MELFGLTQEEVEGFTFPLATPVTVHYDVVGDIDRVRTEEGSQEWDLHRLLLDVVEDRFIQVPRADAIVGGVVEPVALPEQSGNTGLADAGHADQGHGPLLEVKEFAG